VNEIARFQRLSSVNRAASPFQDGAERPDVAGKPLGNTPEQSGRVDAVVVGEGDQVGAQVPERDVAPAREAAGRLQPRDLEPPFHLDPLDPVVVVLVDNENPQGRVVLGLQRVEEATELVRSPDRRDDEVERRKLPRHGP